MHTIVFFFRSYVLYLCDYLYFCCRKGENSTCREFFFKCCVLRYIQAILKYTTTVRHHNMSSDIRKPDLLVHPEYHRALLAYDLHNYFNILTLNDLTLGFDIKPLLVSDKSVHELRNMILEPHFKYHTNGNSKSSKPENTSYYFEHGTPIYTIEENGPRYVIWNSTDPLTICATFVDRIEYDDLFKAYERAKNWSFEITNTKSIIVFDLDETLISKNCKPFQYSRTLLQYARNAYDLVVLYSHGSSLHVDNNLRYFVTGEKAIKFDLVLSNNCIDKRSMKNLLSLYNYFPQTRFVKPTLVDDSLYNWTPEYTKFIVPSINYTLKHALGVIN